MLKELLCLACLVFLLEAQLDALPANFGPSTTVPDPAAAVAKGSSSLPNLESAIASPPRAFFSERRIAGPKYLIPDGGKGIPIPWSSYDLTKEIWRTLQSLDGGCCNKCNEICGFTIKVKGYPYYLTN